MKEWGWQEECTSTREFVTETGGASCLALPSFSSCGFEIQLMEKLREHIRNFNKVIIVFQIY